jgi:peptidoglycan/LPS O-acetylase OafA/YrhL
MSSSQDSMPLGSRATGSGGHGRYRPEIDGMRAIAVIAVLLFHLGLLPNGYLGVDVFFVISGYLITGIIQAEIRAGHFSLVNFYLRRTRRIIPISLFISGLALVLAVLVMLPDDLENLAQSVVATNFFANNILQAITTANYWNVVNEFKPLMHTWSLGVEEQYYLVYPLFLLMAWRLGRSWLLSLILLAAAVSLALYLSPFEYYQKFYYLPFRFFELATGGAAAIALGGDRISGRYLTPLLCGLLAILVLGSPELGAEVQLIAVVLLTVGILVSGDVGNRYGGRLLTNRVAVGLGLISYGFYMWHQVLIAYARYVFAPELRWPHMVAIFLVLIVCSTTTYYLIERPFRDKNRVGTRLLLIACACALALTTSAALYIYSRAGVLKDVPELDITTSNVQRNMHARYNDRIREYDRDFLSPRKVRVLVIGNSFARDWVNVLLESEYAGQLDISYIQTPDTHPGFQGRVAAADVIFLNGTMREDMRRMGIDDTKVWVVGFKNFGTNNGVFYNDRSSERQALRITPRDEYFEQNSKLSQEWGARFIDLMGKLQDENGTVPVFTPSGKFFSQDCEHFTKAGARQFAELLSDDLGRILRKPSR